MKCCSCIYWFSVFNLGGTWVETVSLKIIGKLDEDVEKRLGSNKSNFWVLYASKCHVFKSFWKEDLRTTIKTRKLLRPIQAGIQWNIDRLGVSNKLGFILLPRNWCRNNRYHLVCSFLQNYQSMWWKAEIWLEIQRKTARLCSLWRRKRIFHCHEIKYSTWLHYKIYITLSDWRNGTSGRDLVLWYLIQ